MRAGEEPANPPRLAANDCGQSYAGTAGEEGHGCCLPDEAINYTRGYFPEGAQTGMSIQETQARLDFYVGQEGEFLLLDSFSNPIETVTGKILRLMAGNHTDVLYAMLQTERGIRPARLA